MKKQLFALCTLFIVGAFSYNTALAQSAPSSSAPSGKGGGFEEHKAREIARIEAHLACVQAAQDHAALKACNDHHGQPR